MTDETTDKQEPAIIPDGEEENLTEDEMLQGFLHEAMMDLADQVYTHGTARVDFVEKRLAEIYDVVHRMAHDQEGDEKLTHAETIVVLATILADLATEDIETFQRTVAEDGGDVEFHTQALVGAIGVIVTRLLEHFIDGVAVVETEEDAG